MVYTLTARNELLEEQLTYLQRKFHRNTAQHSLLTKSKRPSAYVIVTPSPPLVRDN